MPHRLGGAGERQNSTLTSLARLGVYRFSTPIPLASMHFSQLASLKRLPFRKWRGLLVKARTNNHAGRNSVLTGWAADRVAFLCNQAAQSVFGECADKDCVPHCKSGCAVEAKEVCQGA